MQKLELKIPPLALCAAFAAAIFLMAYMVPAANLPFPGHQGLSIVVTVVGIFFAISGVIQFRRVRTTVNPLSPGNASSMVTSGVYRLTRNPMYLGMALALIGIAAWWASLPGLLLTLLFCIYMTRFQIEPEERALEAVFGVNFKNYASQVRRWI